MDLAQWRGFKLNKIVPENPFLMVKTQSPGSHVFTRRGNFPSTHSKQSTSSQPWRGSLISNYKGLCAGKPYPVRKPSTISETFTETLWKIPGETSYGTVSSSWWSAQTDQLEMRFAERTGMDVQGNCKFLSCGTGDPSQKARDISVQEETSPKICLHQHKWFNSMQGGSNSNSSSEISLPISGKIWLRYFQQQLLQALEHSVIAGYEGKSINLQKQILVLFRVRFYSSDKEHAWKTLATLLYSLSIVCF